MKTKKSNLAILILLALSLILASCAGGQENAEGDEGAASYAKYNDLQADEEGSLKIPAEAVADEARFFNYDADGVTVQFVTLRDDAGDIHIAFNTCQSCSPSPQAYYQQNGDVLQCTNCGFTFEPEEVGITQGGCNPWPVDGVVIEEDMITIPASAADNMKEAFESWGGPVN